MLTSLPLERSNFSRSASSYISSFPVRFSPLSYREAASRFFPSGIAASLAPLSGIPASLASLSGVPAPFALPSGISASLAPLSGIAASLASPSGVSAPFALPSGIPASLALPPSPSLGLIRVCSRRITSATPV